MNTKTKFRCAVYTRKSTEEGLNQEFNSLDAQREACVAYIASQASLGWRLIEDRFDDGGISGATMERPALQRLLQYVRDGRVDVIVVYKIDRLTRSLMDFSKIVDVLDAHSVSFVSVTQQFNTTTSMGRLTLNVLLSFAQFEREVTAERIRDKIAASRKKGIWMGGSVPLGYRSVSKKLIVDEPAAARVRSIFSRYVQLQSVPLLCDELGRLESGTAVYTRTKLYRMLSNPVYVGRARHRDHVYQGEHDAIVDDDTFANAQRLLKVNAPARRSSMSTSELHLLAGIVFDETGDRLTTVFTSNHGRRYRYYVSSRIRASGKDDRLAWRMPASQLEAIALHTLTILLTDSARLSRWIQEFQYDVLGGLKAASNLVQTGLNALEHSKQRDLIQATLHRVTVGAGLVQIQVRPRPLVEYLCGGTQTAAYTGTLETIDIPVNLRRRGIERRLVIQGADNSRPPEQSLLTLIARAHLFLRMLTDGGGRSPAEVAAATGVHIADLSRALPLAFLAPSLTERILTGRHSDNLSARRLSRTDLSLVWQEQTALFDR